MKILGAIILFLTGFAVPVEYVSFFTFLGIVITPAKVATALLVGYAVLLIVTGPRRPSNAIPTKHLLILVFGFAALVGLVVSLMSNLPAASLLRIGTTWVFLIIFYFTLDRSLLGRADIETFLAGVGLGGVFVTLTGLAGIGFQTYSEQGERIGGYGGNSNELALNLIVAIAVAGYFLSSARKRRFRAIWLVSLPILVLGLVSTLSRSGMLALLLMGALWVLRFRRFDTLKFALPALAVAVGLAALSPDALVERLETMQPDKITSDRSIQSRLKSFPYAVEAFASNPITGVGILGSISFSLDASKGTTGRNVIHNMFLQIGAELGLLGLIPLLAIVWLTWRDCSRCWIRTRREGGWRDPELRNLGLLAAFMQIAFAGVLLIGQFQPTHNQRGVWLLYAITPAIVSLVATRLQTTAAGQRSAAPERREAAPEIGLGAASTPGR